MNTNEDLQGRIYDSPDGRLRPDELIGWDLEKLVPGRLYAQIVLRESALSAGMGVLLLAGAAGVVARRRPG
jgi:hypothetical protein